MAKVILEFNLPEESDEYDLAMRGGKYHNILWDIQQYARSLRKYDDRDTVPKEEIVEKLYELLQEFE